MIKAKYIHTNIISNDWRALAAFYQHTFGCVPVPPERDYRSTDLDALTALVDAHLTGMHLRLPGYGDAGPTLEIFSYDQTEQRNPTALNRLGLGHIAFLVDDVAKAYEAVLAAGGHAIGETVTLITATGTKLCVCYVTDPEGNVIELQSMTSSTT